MVEKVLLDEGFSVLGWREYVPVESEVPGKSAREVMPAFRQVFVEKPNIAGDELNATYTSSEAPRAGGGP